jgi:hypothetical protein
VLLEKMGGGKFWGDTIQSAVDALFFLENLRSQNLA